MRAARSTLLLLAAAAFAFAASAAPKKSKDAAASPAAAPAGVDVNTASVKDLEALPGVGAATARKIVANRPYASVADLSRAGVSKKTIDRIAPMVTVSAASAGSPSVPAKPPRSARNTAGSSAPVSAAPAKTVDLNTASEADLERLPGVGPAYAKKIVAARPYANVADLSRANLPKRTLEKVAPLVTVSGSGGVSAPMGAADRPMTEAPPPKAASPAPASAVPAREGGPSPSEAAAQTPPAPGMVWVNTDTKVYHVAGDRWYGKTRRGKWMTEADAVAAGYRKAKK